MCVKYVMLKCNIYTDLRITLYRFVIASIYKDKESSRAFTGLLPDFKFVQNVKLLRTLLMLITSRICISKIKQVRFCSQIAQKS